MSEENVEAVRRGYEHWGYVARGRASGVPVSLETFALIVMRGGKLTSLRDYDTKAEALEAVGLRE